MLHFHKTLATGCSQTNWEFMMEERWENRIQRIHNFHSSCIDTLNPSFAEFSLSYFTRVWRFWLVQDDRASQLPWHVRRPAICQGSRGDGWQDTGSMKGQTKPSKEVPLWFLLRAWRPLALLGPMSQANVSSPNQLPISHLNCPHSPPSPAEAGACCHPWSWRKQTRVPHGLCWAGCLFPNHCYRFLAKSLFRDLKVRGSSSFTLANRKVYYWWQE